jgi:hypothetical protein
LNHPSAAMNLGWPHEISSQSLYLEKGTAQVSETWKIPLTTEAIENDKCPMS